MNQRLEKSLVGACGVFHVSAELSFRGWVTMPTIRNTKGIDIMATKDGKAVNIQVKTNSYGKSHYPLGKENEELVSEDLFYVFVTLKSEIERPDFFIVPSKLVADYIRKTHDHWTTLPPRINKRAYEGVTAGEIAEVREKSAMRRFPNYIGTLLPEFRDFRLEDYQDKWNNLLKQQT